MLCLFSNIKVIKGLCNKGCQIHCESKIIRRMCHRYNCPIFASFLSLFAHCDSDFWGDTCSEHPMGMPCAVGCLPVVAVYCVHPLIEFTFPQLQYLCFNMPWLCLKISSGTGPWGLNDIMTQSTQRWVLGSGSSSGSSTQEKSGAEIDLAYPTWSKLEETRNQKLVFRAIFLQSVSC